MSGDLKTQVRDYTEFFMGTVESIDLEEIKERPLRLGEGPVQPLASQSRHRGWLVAVAGAVVVLVLGLLTFLTRQTTSEAPAASQPSPSPTVATPAPVPSTPVDGSVSGWSQVPHDEAAFGGASMGRVAPGGPGLVAVGSVHNSSLQVVWTSVDGITWSRVPHHESFSQGAFMNDVTAGGPGLVMVGGPSWFCDLCEGDAVVWTSVDGTTWSRVPHDEAVFGGTGIQTMESVTAGGPGLVAVGAVGWDSAGDDDLDAAVWTSVDGVTWSRVPHDEVVFGGTGIQRMETVTAGGPGLVAFGTAGSAYDEGYRDVAVWTSSDGITWSRVPHDEALFGGVEVGSVTNGGPGLVAVGVGDQGAVVWTSADGITWSRVPHDDAIFGGDPETFMRVVTVGGPGLVAVGAEGWNEQGPLGNVAIWTSVDGITWTRVPYDEATFGRSGLHGLAAWGSGLIAVGGQDNGAAVWIFNEDSS